MKKQNRDCKGTFLNANPSVNQPQSIKEEKGSDAAVSAVAKALDGPTLLVKGKADRISNGKDDILSVDEPGGLKRCGGQGDILSGTLATFLAWTQVTQEEKDGGISMSRRPLLAAYGAATVTRFCSREAFKRAGRAMLAHDLLEEIGKSYSQCVLGI